MKPFILAIVFATIIFVLGLSTQKVAAPEPVAVVPQQEQRSCYQYNHTATADAPYEVQELLDLTINGSTVSGMKKGTQVGPGVSNGHEGTITGTISNGTIEVVFSYIIEGSAGKEKELYRIAGNDIEKLRYPLIEQDGMPVPDTSKDFGVLKYVSVPCEKA